MAVGTTGEDQTGIPIHSVSEISAAYPQSPLAICGVIDTMVTHQGNLGMPRAGVFIGGDDSQKVIHQFQDGAGLARDGDPISLGEDTHPATEGFNGLY